MLETQWRQGRAGGKREIGRTGKDTTNTFAYKGWLSDDVWYKYGVTEP